MDDAARGSAVRLIESRLAEAARGTCFLRLPGVERSLRRGRDGDSELLRTTAILDESIAAAQRAAAALAALLHTGLEPTSGFRGIPLAAAGTGESAGADYGPPRPTVPVSGPGAPQQRSPADMAAQRSPTPAQRHPRLTARQRQVLDLLANGMSNRQIARALGISEKTVKNHMHAIFSRLAVSHRTQAALYAARTHSWGPEASGFEDSVDTV
jgi:DNA-binding CsgD family transcriptional regulator